MTLVVGLTGGIGSGKSAAAHAFAAHGACIIDTDAIAHALTAPGGAAIAALVQAFGPDILTTEGGLDRSQMRRRVFAAASDRVRLEAILHPLIRDECTAQVHRSASADFRYVILAVPLLIETGSYRDQVNRVAVVDCPEALQITRVMARSGLTRPEVEAILAVQATRQARLAAADDVIANDGSVAQLDARVAELHDQYSASAHCPKIG